MISIQKKVIREVIEELNGIPFEDAQPYSEKTKVFFEDRYASILELLPIKKNDVVLEVGLLGGILAFLLKRTFSLRKLYALEHPIICAQYTPRYLRKLKTNSIVLKPVDLRVHKFPWPDQTFNVLVFSEVMEHLIPADVPGILLEMKRVLKKKGFLIVTTPNIGSLLKRINLLFGKNPIEFDLTLHEEAVFGHIREYTMSELVEILQSEKFKIIEKRYLMFDAKRSLFTRIEAASAKVFPFLANDLAIIAQKA